MNTKNHARPVIIILVAITVLVSFMPVSAFAQITSATAILDISCGLDVKKGIDLGILRVGEVGTEVTTIIRTAGTANSIVSVNADDWREGETRSTAIITIGGDEVPFPNNPGTILSINGVFYIGLDHMPIDRHSGFFHFDEFNDEHTAESITLAINSNNRYRSTVDEPNQYIFAKAIGNQIILTASVGGISGNNVTMWAEDGDYIKLDSDKMYGGYDGINPEHMLSSVTRYAITTDGSSSSGTLYSEKTSFPQKGVSHILTTQASPANDINLSLQISGFKTLFALPYSGPLYQELVFTSECE